MQNPISYSALIRGNRNFRWLWTGMMVSLFGDWFNTIALYEMVGSISKSPMALAGIFALKALPFTLFAPLGGMIADRLDRRRIMIVMDVVRAIVVLGLICANYMESVGSVYILVTAQVAATAFFHPAYQALFPNIIKDDELLTASALLSASWSVLLASGAALGGLALTIFPRWAVLLVDAASYLLSAICVWQIVAPKMERKPFGKKWLQQGYAGIVEGWQFMRHKKEVAKIALAKSAWASGGGALVFMLSLLGMQMMPEQPALGIGLLYSARGLGTGIGPVTARRFLKTDTQWLRLIGLAVMCSSVVYAAAGSGVFSWFWIVVFVCIAHALSGANWVLSSVMLQKCTPDAFRGRVMSSELLLVTFIESTVTLLAGFLLHKNYLLLNQNFLFFASIQFICGLAWYFSIFYRTNSMSQNE